MAHDAPGREPGADQPVRSNARSRAWSWLLVVPLIGTLVPPIYNVKDPTLIGIPFFYWYQMVWIPVSVLCTVLVYRVTTRRDG